MAEALEGEIAACPPPGEMAFGKSPSLSGKGAALPDPSATDGALSFILPPSTECSAASLAT